VAVYATAAQLATYTGTAAPADAVRLLTRASELIDEATRGDSKLAYDGLLSGISRVIPTEVAPYTQQEYRDALAKAVCAQCEFWAETGEEHDTAGLRGSLAAGKLSISQLPDVLARRALRALREVNLTGGSVPIS
jgi:hypothetical protein